MQRVKDLGALARRLGPIPAKWPATQALHPSGVASPACSASDLSLSSAPARERLPGYAGRERPGPPGGRTGPRPPRTHHQARPPAGIPQHLRLLWLLRAIVFADRPRSVARWSAYRASRIRRHGVQALTSSRLTPRCDPRAVPPLVPRHGASTRTSSGRQPSGGRTGTPARNRLRPRDWPPRPPNSKGWTPERELPSEAESMS